MVEAARSLVSRGREALLAHSKLLPVEPDLADLLPDGALRRGTVVALSASSGSTSLLFAVLAGTMSEGSWAAIVGLPDAGLEAAAGSGVALEHLALVPDPGPRWPEVVGALLDSLDVVAVVPPARCRPGDARRLAARARERGSVLVVSQHAPVGGTRPPPPWPDSVDLRLEAGEPHWQGLGAGHGTLECRSVTVRSFGRRGGGKERLARLLLPDPDGHLAPGTSQEDPTPLGAEPDRPPEAAAGERRAARRHAGERGRPPGAAGRAGRLNAVRTLVAWCPDWPVTAGGRPASQRVGVLEANRVVAASAAARKAGVQLGLRRRDAESRCPGLLVVPRDPSREARMFEPVVAAIATLTPQVEVTRAGLLALDTRGPARYFGGEEALCRRVAELVLGAVATEGAPPPRVGVADGRFAATLAARRGVIVPPGGNRPFLAPFPVAVLGQPELADLLRRLGVYTLGGFAELPASAVLGRFGTEAARTHDLASGTGVELLETRAPPEELARTTTFDPPAERADVATFAGRALAAELGAWLGQRGLSCTRLRIEVQTEHGESLVRLWGGDGMIGADGMIERLRWQLDGWLSGTTSEEAPTAGITLLRLGVEEVAPLGSRQRGLWGGASHADLRAARGLDRLRGMLGADAIFIAALRGGRSPADRVELVPWGEPRPTPSAAMPWPGHHPLPAPALVHRPPLAMDLAGPIGEDIQVSARGELSAAPGRISVQGGHWRAIVGWAGPWLTDERWWDLGSRRRLARFQIVTEDHTAHLCIVEKGRWWIEGTYD